jgi:CheY-like chemotaxis protein
MFDYALRIGGFDVSSAGDGLSALRIIEERLAPDVIVLDLDLPQVSGVDVQQELAAHEETRRTPVIVVTGTSWHVPTGVFRTLRKPITSDALVRIVWRALTARKHVATKDRPADA